ncbi:diguanylate cyclase [Neobacillus pocheonensis]|uniref:Diguanylate cyclase n=1 Tax=Neobacillus pocheonensis TaxID=363869 RepID=A0ABT0WDK1_9BACI|nr:diguanylate cyclase [Neobacillus pocheonensis]
MNRTINNGKLQACLLIIPRTIQRKITCSFGVTEYKKGDTKHSLLSRADKALYISKENGRNQVSVI